jgi:hypothetical protein
MCFFADFGPKQQSMRLSRVGFLPQFEAAHVMVGFSTASTPR